MPIKLYMNHHVPKAITVGHAITAYEDNSNELDDPLLLDRAMELKRVLFSQDDDLLAEATTRQREGGLFQGLIYAHQQRVSIGGCIRDLEIIAKAGKPEDFMNRVVFLPLRSRRA